MSYPYRIKTRNQYAFDNIEDPSQTSVRQKNFSSFSRATGKITRFNPKPTLSQSKPIKQKSKNIYTPEETIKIKIKEIEKPMDHMKYFDKLEVSCKLPPKKNKQLRISEATTSPNFGDNSRQIDYHEEVVSFDWQNIKKSPARSLLEKLIINCNPHVNMSTNFCTCDHPCKWASKWNMWSKEHNPFAYRTIRKREIKNETDVQIKKDLKRTQPECISFQLQSNLDKLEQVLQAYAKYDQQLEYVQGMNLITSTILYHVKNPQQTFWIFVDLMERKQLRQLYLNKFQTLFYHTKIVKRLLYLKVNDLFCYLQDLQLDIDSVMLGWILSLMLKVVPLEFSHLAIDAFIQEGFLAIYKIIITYLIYLKEELFIRNDSSDVLHRLSPSFQKDKQNWEEILLTAQSININQSDIKQITRSTKF